MYFCLIVNIEDCKTASELRITIDSLIEVRHVPDYQERTLKVCSEGNEAEENRKCLLFLFHFNFLFICSEDGEEMCLSIEDPVFQGEKVVVGKY